MLILLNTSQPTCRMIFIDSTNDRRFTYDWNADRSLAKDLLGYIDEKLNENKKTWSDIKAIGVFEGPGSFTGIRIGMTVMNTIADTQHIPIVGGRGDLWESVVVDKIRSGANEKIVLPFYGSDANITTQRK